MKPKISLFATAYRPQYWMNLYDTLRDNKISFEIVFVGPNEPSYPLPDNFYYIKSNVKPAQCIEIATRCSVGELIMQIADDIEFVTDHALDQLYDLYKTVNNELIMLSPRYLVNDVDLSELSTHFFYGDLSSPMLAVGMILSNSMYRSLGGIDKNFIAIHGESDIAMQLYALGGSVLLSDVYINEDKGKSQGSDLCNEAWKHDRKVLEDLWLGAGKLRGIRSRPFEPFTDERILEESQGPKGRWI